MFLSCTDMEPTNPRYIKDPARTAQ